MSVHAETRGGLIHPRHKGRFGTAEVIAHGSAGAAGRRQKDQLQHRIHGILFAFVQRHIGITAGIGYGGTVGGDGHDRVIGDPSRVDILKDHIGGHQFGQTGRRPPCIGVFLKIAGAGITVQHKGGRGAYAGSRGLYPGGTQKDKESGK